MISARTASSLAASEHKSDASRRTLRSLLHKTWQIRVMAAAGEERQGSRGWKYTTHYILCECAVLPAGTPLRTNSSLAQVYKYRNDCFNSHAKYITTGTENYTSFLISRKRKPSQQARADRPSLKAEEFMCHSCSLPFLGSVESILFC